MKKYLLLSFALFVLDKGMAQEASFFKDKWKILELKSIFKGSSTSIYHRDSADNALDYSKYEIKFLQDGSYNGVSTSGSNYKGTWSFTQDKDSAMIDGSRYLITQLTSNYFTTRTFKMQLADTLGTLEIAYNDFTMYSIPDITTSLYETAMGSENVKVFPNPVKDILEIKWTNNLGENITNVRLTNTMGQVMKNYTPDKSVSSLSVDMSELHFGIYTLEAINAEGKRVAIKKVVKE